MDSIPILHRKIFGLRQKKIFYRITSYNVCYTKLLRDVRLVESRILSRAEIARRDGVDPAVMRTEMAAEDAGTAADGGTPH